MSNEEIKVTKETKGRLSWLIPVFEAIVAIAYFLIGFRGIKKAAGDLDIGEMFHSVEVAVWFLVIATAVITALCFVRIFKSKTNTMIAIFNIVWMGFTIYSLM